jgi:hypothetical protein
MKAYILTEKDLELLKTMIDRDPKHGYKGGSSGVISKEESEIYDEVHRFYNYQVCRWIDEISKS